MCPSSTATPSDGSDGQPLSFRVLPFRIVVAGRFGLETGRLHRLDDDGTAGLLERTAPSIALAVDDTLRGDGTRLNVSLTVRHRRDFTAGKVARAVPDLARLLDAHEAARKGESASGIRGRLSDLTAVVRSLGGETAATAPAATPAPSQSDGPREAPKPTATPNPPPTPPSGSGDDDLDRLLGMVDTGTPAAPAAEPDVAQTAVRSFISEVTRSSRRPAPRSDLPAPQALEAAVAEQLGLVLTAPEFRDIERAWTALRFLTRRADRRSRISVDVVEADAGTVADALENLVPEDDHDGAGPVRLVVCLSDFDGSDRDTGRLAALARFGQSRRAVVLASADPAFAGPEGPEAVADRHDPETLFEDARFAGWRNLRGDDASRWLGVALSRIALREAQDGRNQGQLGFAAAIPLEPPLDIGAAPAIAAVLAASVAASDWPCALRTATDTMIENLVLIDDGAGGFKGAVRPQVTTGRAQSLANAGLIALVAERGRDAARLTNAPSVHRPAKAADPEATADSSLIAALFRSQVVHGIQWNADRIFVPGSHEAVRDRLLGYLTSLMSTTGPGAGAEVTLERDRDDGSPLLGVHVRSGSAVAPGESMGFEIPLGAA